MPRIDLWHEIWNIEDRIYENLKGVNMILVFIKMNALTERRKELMQTLVAMVALIRKEKGCISCQLLIDNENETSFNLVEEWDSQEKLNNHLRSDRFGVLLGAKSILSEPPEIRIIPVPYTAGMEAVKAERQKEQRVLAY